MSSLASKARKAVLRPDKVPGYVKRLLDEKYNSIEGTRIVWPEAGRARTENFSLRRPVGSEVLVRTAATVVSPGTERAFFNGQPSVCLEFPYYPGYSGAGIALRVGPGVSRFRPGDRVAGPLPHASAVLVEQSQLTPVPDQVTPVQASFLQLGIIALQGVRKARIQVGECVAIAGQGLVGILATQLAARAGSYPLIAIAETNTRLPLAARLGAHRTISVSDAPSALEHIRADVTIDATGRPDALNTALACTRDGGRIVLLGSTRGITRAVDVEQICERRLTIIGGHVDSLACAATHCGVWNTDREAETFFRFVVSGRLAIEPLITDALFPPEAELFYRRLSRSDRSILGAVFHWDSLQTSDESSQRAVSKAGSADPKAARTIVTIPIKKQDGRIASVDAPARNHQMNKSLRVGMIGCGEIGVQNAQAVADSTMATIVAVADVNEAVAADMAGRYHVPYTTDVSQMLHRPDVDAVLISVPHYLHAPLAIQAAEAGKHVMVEKPMATSVADADRMIEACQRAGVKLSVVYCQRYSPPIQQAKRLIGQRALGEVLGIQLAVSMDKPPSYYTSGFSGRVHSDWRLSREKSGGGILIFNLVHYLDIVRFLTELEVARVGAEFGSLDTPVDTEDTIAVSLRYANGAIGSIAASSVVRGASYQPQIRLWGKDGQMNLREPDDYAFYSLRQIDDHRPGQWHRLQPHVLASDRREYVTRFAQAVIDDGVPEISGEDGRAIQAIVEAIYRAGEAKRPSLVGA